MPCHGLKTACKSRTKECDALLWFLQALHSDTHKREREISLVEKKPAEGDGSVAEYLLSTWGGPGSISSAYPACLRPQLPFSVAADCTGNKTAQISTVDRDRQEVDTTGSNGPRAAPSPRANSELSVQSSSHWTWEGGSELSMQSQF